MVLVDQARGFLYVYFGYLRSGVWSRPQAGRKIAEQASLKRTGLSVNTLLQKSAADSGADIFFVPNNPVTKEMKADPDAKTNYQEAKEAAKKSKTKMKIVPVKQLKQSLIWKTG